MRIAIVTETYPPEVNGVALTVARAAAHLQARGHVVDLARPRQASDPLRDPASVLLVPGAPIPLYPQLRFGFPVAGKLRRHWSDPVSRPDLVHVATEGPLGWAAVSAATHLGIPSTSDFRTNFHQYGEHYGLGVLKSPIGAYLRTFHNRTRRTFVPTRAMKASLETAGYANVVVSGRGVDCHAFSPARRDLVLRRRWRAERDDVVVLYVGRLAPEKNCSLVMDAFLALKAASPRARLVLVGDGPSRHQLAAQCPDAVFAGMQQGDALGAHYASADMFLFPSLTETFGNVTLEALASGLAVVAFDRAAAKVHIVDSVNGRVAPADDATRFIQAAVALGRDAEGRARIRQAARQSALAAGWDAVLTDFEHELERVFEVEERVDERTCFV